MPKIPPISDAEWRVMQAVWCLKTATAEQVIESLADESDWQPRTIKTMLGRLLRKGALAHKSEGKRYLYYATVSRDAVLRAESRSFLDRVFAGDALQAMTHLAKVGHLTDADLKKLRKLIEKDM